MMSGAFTRMKRVTDPLDDKVKARIVGWDRPVEPFYASSGSEYSPQADDDVTSSSLSELFYGFTVGESAGCSPETDDSDSARDLSIFNPNDANIDSIKPIVQDKRDDFQNVLRAHVLKAVHLYSCSKLHKQIMRRNVMAFLRNCGYNAAICKTKWETSGGHTAGNYEFIDVVRMEYSVRYFIDLDFAAEFEIARPTSSYEQLMQYMPSVFVGKCEELKPILKAASDAAKRSLKSRDLLLPPWKKHRFMRNKWLGSYRRTTNLYPASVCTSSSSTKQIYGAVKCRAVGFDVNVNDGKLFPARTIIRKKLI